MITRGDIEYEIYTRLQKSPAVPGFYTKAKVDSAVQESVDFVAAEQMLADEGFCHKLIPLNTVSGMVSLAVPQDVAMIIELRYLINNVYYPMTYDQQFGQLQWASSSGVVQQYPGSYRIIDNNFFFNPPLGVGGPGFAQLECMSYPRRFGKDGDMLPAQFDRAMFWFIVYRSCNILAGQVQQTIDDWQQNEQLWYGKTMQMINMRTRQVIPIREYDG